MPQVAAVYTPPAQSLLALVSLPCEPVRSRGSAPGCSRPAHFTAAVLRFHSLTEFTL